jgi:predicted ribosome quality control (RQC) complex YloA/Tae2 family protein
VNYSDLSAVVGELALLLPGSGVERVLESAGNSILLELHSRRNKLHLLLSPDRAFPRLHLLSHKPQTAPLSHAFPLFLRSRIAGARVAGIRLLNEDRVVEILFLRRGAEYRLLFELVGRAANLIIIDGAGVILAVYYPAPVSGKIARVLLPGLRYEPPLKRAQPEQAGQPVFIPAEKTEARRTGLLNTNSRKYCRTGDSLQNVPDWERCSARRMTGLCEGGIRFCRTWRAPTRPLNTSRQAALSLLTFTGSGLA